MSMRLNKAKHQLKDGNVVIGTGQRIPAPALTELLGYADFDFVFLDAEHGAMGWTQIEAMVLAAYAADVTPVVRVLHNDPALVMRALDVGAQGILIPHCCNAAAAQRYVDGALYPPIGKRGVGPSRGIKWGAIPQDEYFSVINDEVLLMAMIEDAEAVEDIEEICKVPGLDVLIVGTSDLAASYGLPGQHDHPRIKEATAHVLEVGNTHGVAISKPARSIDDATEAIEQGYRVVTLGTAEAFIFRHLSDCVAKIRSA